MPEAPRNQIVVGDCIEIMNGWPAESVDLIFADPPYNIGFKYDQYEDRRDDADYIAWTERWISACARLLKPTGSLFILIGDEYAAEARLHLKQLERDRQLVFRNWIIWHYTFGQNCKAKLNRSHAHLLYAVGKGCFDWKKAGAKKSGKVASGMGGAMELPFTFNREEVAVASARQTTYGDARANPKGKLPDDTWYLRPQEAIDDRPGAGSPDLFSGNGAGDPGDAQDNWLFDADGDTWYLSRLCGTFKERLGWHPCQLPEALLERVIKLASHEGDVVFDPFVGSGTTLAVAARLGRDYLGCELSQDYADKATQRIEHVKQTGEAMTATYQDKGIAKGKPKKKAEPRRWPKGGKRAARVRG